MQSALFGFILIGNGDSTLGVRYEFGSNRANSAPLPARIALLRAGESVAKRPAADRL